jgi:hypothetical protein
VSGPESLESLTQHARWTRDALERAAGVKPAPPPENETAIEGFVRRTREQAELERRDEALARRVANENPTAPTRETLDDPLRAVAREQRAGRRRRKRRGRIP